MKILDDYKRKQKKKKREKEKLKKYEQELIEEEKKIEAELDSRSEPKEKPYDLFLSLVFDDDHDEEDKELEKYKTESERQAEEEDKVEIKKMYIKIGVIYSIVFIILGIGVFIAYNLSIPKIIKETKPLLENYYKNKFGEEVKITNIELMCTVNKETREKECSDIIKADLENGNHLFAIKNTTFGDDMSQNYILNDYITSFDRSVNIGILTHDPMFSFEDYYLNYNKDYNYIRALPDGYKYQNLYNTGKLTVLDRIVHTKPLNASQVKAFMSKLSDDSRMYFIRTIDQTPVTFSVVTKKGYISIDLLNKKALTENVTYYETDIYQNKIGSVEIMNVSSKFVEALEENYKFRNTYSIDIKEARLNNYVRNEEDKRPQYYVLHFKDGLGANISLFNVSRGDYYQELEVDKYPEYITFDTAQGVYLIGTTRMSFGNKYYEKESFICKRFNIC